MNNVYRVVRATTFAFHRLFGRIKVVGHDRIPKTGPVIVASNHVSYLDPTILGSVIRRECAFIARHDLFEKRWLAWLLPKLGTFPVNRDKLDRSAIKKGLEALEAGLVFVIFPEGGRSDDLNLQPAEPGVALFVQKSGAPVVPCALIGPEKMLPPGARKLNRVRLKCVFGDPMFFTPDMSRDDIVRGIMRAIAKLITEHDRPMVAAEDRADTARA